MSAVEHQDRVRAMGLVADLPQPRRLGYPAALRDEVDEYLRGLRFSTERTCLGLEEAMRYSLLSGGKRVRPVLVLATARALGVPHRGFLPLAGAVELIHTFSLIHDDLPCMDDDDLRRGRPASHCVFGEGVAVLAGDALFAEAFRLIAQLDAPAGRVLGAVRVIADALSADGVAGGQYLDLAGAARDEADVLNVHRLKTGRLFEASVGAVLELVRPPVKTVTALMRYCAELGVMFQIVDDVIDATGASGQVQRAVGSDQRNSRRTMTREGGVGRAIGIARACLSRIEDALAAAPCRGEELLAIAEAVCSRAAA